MLTLLQKPRDGALTCSGAAPDEGRTQNRNTQEKWDLRARHQIGKQTGLGGDALTQFLGPNPARTELLFGARNKYRHGPGDPACQRGG